MVQETTGFRTLGDMFWSIDHDFFFKFPSFARALKIHQSLVWCLCSRNDAAPQYKHTISCNCRQLLHLGTSNLLTFCQNKEVNPQTNPLKQTNKSPCSAIFFVSTIRTKDKYTENKSQSFLRSGGDGNINAADFCETSGCRDKLYKCKFL